MPAQRERRVTLRAQWLGQILRELRTRRDLTLREAADYLQKDFSTVSRFEQGTFPVRRGDLVALLDLYGIDDAQQREMFTQLCVDVWRTGWWEKYTEDEVWGSTIDYVWLENRAHAMQVFATLSAPGLLQTREYARALITTANAGATEEQVERWVELRMKRQRVLDREEPAEISVVLDEAALRRPVADQAVMRAQIERLHEVAELPHVELQVLPFAAGTHPSPDGAFTLLSLKEPFSTVAHIESPGGGIYLERGDVDRLTGIYDRLQESSLDTAQSVRFLSELDRDYQ